MTTKRQRQKENRAIRLEAERKAAQRAGRIRTARNLAVLVGVVLVPVLLVSFLSGGDDEPEATTTTVPAVTTTTTPEQARQGTTYDLFAAQPTACGAEIPPAPADLTFEAADDQEIPADAVVTAVLTTSCGDISLELDPSIAPETVNSFVFLARQGFYDGSPMHRIDPSFIIQGGDPTGTGVGGPGYAPTDEFPPAGTTYDVGDLAMANSSGPNTAGSQFFIVLEENQLHLSGLQFTKFGRLMASEDTIAAIRSVPLGFNNFDQNATRPLESIYIESVTITVG
ncbi:MAG: peptidylprolyl isomerase [Acidimicrobiia bacterium]|nr:peptidylprolyl isomerase [Acidimicrobiia bacterium]